MDKKYITLFRDIAQATAASAEQVMDYDREKNDEKGLETATTMRDDYQDLVTKLSDDDYVISKSDASKLLIGVTILVNHIQDRINNLKKAMTGYQTDLIPKLEEIITAENDEEAAKIVKEKFIIEEK